MLSDIDIAHRTPLKPITDVAATIGLSETDLNLYGPYKAKIKLEALRRPGASSSGKLVLVTAITPTPLGEGKTTVSIGLSQAFWKLGKRSVVALREPSLGPVFGLKGGATGGGYSQVLPMEDINLHFTGDFHAVTAAHNLLSAVMDAMIFHGNEVGIDPGRILWPRTIDMNDRSLRNVVIGLKQALNGPMREERFVITPDSEIMAILGLSKSYSELKERINRILVGFTRDRHAVYAEAFKSAGAMAALLKDALLPNLVQTTENTPAIIHTGPFGNIAHGTCSLTAIEAALALSEYAVVEAGFGSDLGGEKFLNIVSRLLGRHPDVAVLVVTIRALKYHGGMDKNELTTENLNALERGFENVQAHLHILKNIFGMPVVVAINRFPQDTEAEIEKLSQLLVQEDVPFALSEGHARGGEGVTELAKAVMDTIDRGDNHYRPLYSLDLPLKQKIELVAHQVYSAGAIKYSKQAERALRIAEKNNLNDLFVCMAKTQSSISDDPTLRGWPRGYNFYIDDIRFRTGAGFAVPICGNILEMPGLPKQPAAWQVDIDDDGTITGLF